MIRLASIVLAAVLAASAALAEDAPALRSGFIQVPGGPIWYEMAGDSATDGGVPLLTLHGGPGGTSCGLQLLYPLADERAVIRYDQLGTGRSGRPTDPSLWQRDRFVEALHALREALGLERMHLHGHSWGGALAAYYVLEKGTEGIVSLTLSSPLISTPLWIRDANDLRATLDPEIQEALTRHEEAGTTEDPEYVEATEAFYEQFVRRGEPVEDASCADAPWNPVIYEQMWGPTEFYATGSLGDFDLTPRLHDIDVPTLFITGEHDEARPETIRSFAERVPGARFEVLPEVGHASLSRAPEAYRSVLREFLRSAEGAGSEDFDVILRGGRVVDGTGNPWFRADVALRGDRIAAVGDLASATAPTIIDLEGLVVAPGFIDTHSHAGPGLATPGLSHAEPLLAQGITTVFVNPDGGGEVDIGAQRAALLADGLGVHVAQFVPHGAVRTAVLGMADRAPTGAELNRMRALVREGMAAGAWGLSSGPFYAPGSFASTEELVALAREAAAFGGAYQSHVRDEADYSVGLMAALEEVITVAREAGLPGVHTHVKALGPSVWGFSDAIVERIDSARAAGVEVYTDQYPYLASATSLSAALVPRWAQAGGREALLERLEDDADAGRIRAAVTQNLARRGGAARIQFRRVESDPSLEGQRLSDVAEQWKTDPVAAALRLIAAGDVGIVSFNMDEGDVRTLMRQPWTMTASDGGLVPLGEGVPHPRSYGTFPHKLRHYVLEEGVLTLEGAVRSMTSLPAQVYRMADRGRVAPGWVADIVVLDLDTLRDHATFTAPHQLSEGVVHVFVAGERAVADGRFTGARAGRVLRRSEAPD